MKIEKISENQIKLTLSSEDLKENNIRIEELIKPTDKTQELFRNLMEKAFRQCGFEVDNTPLMVEATPILIDSLMIIITKLPDNSLQKENLELIAQNKDLRRYKKKGIAQFKSDDIEENDVMVYYFSCFDNAIDASVRIANMFSGYSEIYTYNQKYFLLLQSNDKNKDSTIEYILNEYGSMYSSNVLTKYFLMEHGNTLIHNPALKIIADNFS